MKQMAGKGQGIEILTGWQAGIGGEDFLRELVQRTVQQVLDATMTSFLRAETCERNDERRGWRNGFKPRTLKTCVGGLEISKSQVSALTQKLDAEVAEWRTRPLTEAYTYLIFDARYEKVRRGGTVVSQGVLVAIGISAKGYREVLGCWVAESKSEASWGAVFREFKER
jgi:transposase-like protein